MTKKSPFLVALLTIVTFSIYGWYIAYEKQNSNLDKLQAAPRRWPLKVLLALLLALVPLDIWLRIMFIARPGFLQVELISGALILLLVCSFLSAKLQKRLNDLAIYYNPDDDQTSSQSQPSQNYPAATVPAVPQTIQPAAIIQQPQQNPAPITGSDWQKGMSTLQPTINTVTEPEVNSNDIPDQTNGSGV